MQPDAEAILLEVLASYSDADKWVGAPFEAIKRLSNTKVGDAGQDFLERLCDEVGFEAEFPERPEVATGEAGHLVSMEKGGSVSHKLTKRRGQLRPIHEFEDHVLNLVAAIDQHRREAP